MATLELPTKFHGGTPLTMAWDGQNRLAGNLVYDLERRVLDRGDAHDDLVRYGTRVLSRLPKRERGHAWRSIVKTARNARGLFDVDYQKRGGVTAVAGLRLRTRDVSWRTEGDPTAATASEPSLVCDYLAIHSHARHLALFAGGLANFALCGHALLRCTERGAVRYTDDLLQAVLHAERASMAAAATLFRGLTSLPPANHPTERGLQVLLPAAGGAFICEPIKMLETSQSSDEHADVAAVIPRLVVRKSAKLHPVQFLVSARTFLHESELDDAKRDALLRMRQVVAPLMAEDRRIHRRALADTLPDVPFVEYAGENYLRLHTAAGPPEQPRTVSSH